MQAVGSMRLFSVRHEFPAEWARFTNQVPPADHRFELKLNLRPEHYPFWSQGRLKKVTRVDVLARSTATSIPGSIEVWDKAAKNDDPASPAKKDSLTKDRALGNLLVGRLTKIALPAKPAGEFTLFFDDKALTDLWLALTWS